LRLNFEPQFFFTPVYSSTVFVVIVVTGFPCLSGAVLYVAVVVYVRHALQLFRQSALRINAVSKASRKCEMRVVRSDLPERLLPSPFCLAAIRLSDLNICLLIVRVV